MPQRLSMDGRRRRGATFALILLASMLLAACGPLGDDDGDEPPATSDSLAQPTTSSTTGSTESPDGEETSVAGETETGEQNDVVAGEEGTPDGPEVIPVSTPIVDGPPGQDIGTPVIDPGPNDTGTPVPTGPFASPVATEAVYTGEGDGTSGATPPPPAGAGPGSGTMLVAETPDAAGIDSASPVASPVGEATSLAELSVTMVASCEPETVPEVALADVAYVTADDVNIRSGPGVDCGLLPISPIGVFMPVTLVGGPVSRDGEDFTWVQVTTSTGDTGWVITTALEPAS